MKRYRRELTLLAVAAATAFAVCWANNHYFRAAPQDEHRLLHEQLGITPEQDRRIGAIEQRFAGRKMQLEGTIREANAELGQAILADKQYSARVQAAVDTIHHAQGELQKATLEHLFEMQTALTPEQSEKLNRMAADALIHHP